MCLIDPTAYMKWFLRFAKRDFKFWNKITTLTFFCFGRVILIFCDQKYHWQKLSSSFNLKIKFCFLFLTLFSLIRLLTRKRNIHIYDYKKSPSLSIISFLLIFVRWHSVSKFLQLNKDFSNKKKQTRERKKKEKRKKFFSPID